MHESIYDEFVKCARDLAAGRKVGQQFEAGVKQGPQISNQQLGRVLAYVESAIKEGATLETGGKRIDTSGFFMEPTVFSNVTDNMTIAKEEVRSN